MWNDLSMKEKSAYMKVALKNDIKDLNLIRDSYNKFEEGGYESKFQNTINSTINIIEDAKEKGRSFEDVIRIPVEHRNKEVKKHVVNKGDSLWKISRENKLSLDDLRKYNPQLKGDTIFPGNELNLEEKETQKELVYRNVKDIRHNERIANNSNTSAIQSVKHKNNYAIIDKVNSTMTIFDKNNNVLYKTSDIATGKSGNDYNTITYVNKDGSIRSGVGNESTPAGITEITAIGKYHDVPTYIRGRKNDNTGEVEDIASSMHYGSTINKKASNGCVRIGGKTLCDMEKYVNKGTKIYTLPEKEGSRFVVKDGKINFFADNPYGESTGENRFWDDYNVTNDKSHSPLLIKDSTKKDNTEYYKNRQEYSKSISDNKDILQAILNLDSDTYNRIAELAVGIAEQETKYNTSTRKKIKDIIPDEVLNTVRGNNNRSRGYTQIKLMGDNKGMQDLYKKLNINKENLDTAEKSAVATMARLAYMYNTEVRGRKYINNDGDVIDSYDALLYKWMGRNNELKNKTATPKKNSYINNVKEYSKRFDFYSGSYEDKL